MKSTNQKVQKGYPGYLCGILTGFCIAFIAITIIQNSYHFVYSESVTGIIVDKVNILNSTTSPQYHSNENILNEDPTLTNTAAIQSLENPRTLFGLINRGRNPISRKPNDGKLKPLDSSAPHMLTQTQTPLTTAIAIASAISAFSTPTAHSKQISFNASKPEIKKACFAKYGTKRFLKLSEKRLPPMLYTFPGSGNTWGRLLIEHATGVYTGSVYNDASLLQALPGEFTCDWRVSAVKVHPHTHEFSRLNGASGGFNSDANKCKRGNIPRFERAVLLIRDPFDSIWSEFQRRVTQSHVEGILKSTFNWPRWQANAANLAHQYLTMWEVHYMGIERAYRPEDVLYIRYEDLKDKDRRIHALNQLVTFLKLPVSTAASIAPEREQLECAFVLADNERAHRSVDVDIEMTKAVAYTAPLACRMWALFGKYAGTHGYGPWPGANCSSSRDKQATLSALPMVNVGPRGEYNKQWVKPGQKLLDFGGHEETGAVVGKGQQGTGKGDRRREEGVKRPDRKMFLQALSTVGEGMGMDLDEAMSVSGIGKLGENSPVWA